MIKSEISPRAIDNVVSNLCVSAWSVALLTRAPRTGDTLGRAAPWWSFPFSVFLYFCFIMCFPTFPLKTLYGNDSLTYNFFHLNPAVENITSVSNLRPSIFRFCCWLPLVLLALHDGTVVMIIIVVAMITDMIMTIIIVVAMITDIKMMIIIIVTMITDCLSRWYEKKHSGYTLLTHLLSVDPSLTLTRSPIPPNQPLPWERHRKKKH